MPSKKNKKEAAAEKARLAKLQAPDEVPAVPAQAEPKEEEAKPEQPKSSESSSDRSPSSDSKKVPFKPPPKMSPLTVAKPLTVITNSFPMELKSMKVHRYDVNITKYEGGKEMKIAGAEGSGRQQQAILFDIVSGILGKLSNVWCYDGAATLHSIGAIQVEPKHVDSKDLSPAVKASLFPRGAQGSLTILITPNQEIPTLNTANLLNEDLSNKTACPVRQMLQIALCQEARKKKYTIVDGGNELFEKGTPVRDRKWVVEMNGVGAGIKVADGVQGTGAAHLVMEYKKTQFFNSIPLADLGIDFNDRYKAMKFLKGLRLNTTYSNQSFMVNGLSDEPMVKITYPGGSVLKDAAKLSGRKESSFNQQWPAVQFRSNNRKTNKTTVYSFPIENLVISPNQKLGPKHGNPPRCAIPQERFEQTKRVGENAGLISANPTLKGFGVTVQSTPVSVQANPIPVPSVVYNGGSVVPDIHKGAKWNLPRTAKFVSPTKIPEILILYNTSTCRSNHHSQEVFNKIEGLKMPLKDAARNLGVLIERISSEDLGDTYSSCSIFEAIDKKMDSLKGKKTVVIYCDESNQQTHGLLKLKERQCEIVTQQLALDKALKRGIPGASTLSNIVLKLNIKSGGLNHKVAADPMISHLWGDKSKTLIISYDVCHSSGVKAYKKGEEATEPSSVGFAFNGGAHPEAFIGDFHLQLPRNEEVNQKLLKIRSRLMVNSYFNSRKEMPQHIVILRDGVSEGQHMMVYNKELPAIRDGIQDALRESGAINKKTYATPSIALLVVTKRHAHRLYLKGNEITNVPPMIAIDKGIVKTNGNELIFVSHCPLNGTAQPIIVNILVNENVFNKNDELVRFLAALSCTHQTSTTIVSLPEPIYAADEYAKRGADLFESYKLYKPPGDAMPSIEVENPKDETKEKQFDWDAISLKLCYQSSGFRKIRIA